MLLLKIWGGKRSGLPTITNTEIEDVQKCMRILKTNEKRCVIHNVSRFLYNSLSWQMASSGAFVVMLQPFVDKIYYY